MSTHTAVVLRTQYGQHYARCSCGHVGRVADTEAAAEHHHHLHVRFAASDDADQQWRLAA